MVLSSGVEPPLFINAMREIISLGPGLDLFPFLQQFYDVAGVVL